MPIVKAAMFASFLLITLIIVLHFGLNWKIFDIAILLVIGVILIASSIWGYKQMYSEDD